MFGDLGEIEIKKTDSFVILETGMLKSVEIKLHMIFFFLTK